MVTQRTDVRTALRMVRGQSSSLYIHLRVSALNVDPVSEVQRANAIDACRADADRPMHLLRRPLV